MCPYTCPLLQKTHILTNKLGYTRKRGTLWDLAYQITKLYENEVENHVMNLALWLYWTLKVKSPISNYIQPKVRSISSQNCNGYPNIVMSQIWKVHIAWAFASFSLQEKWQGLSMCMWSYIRSGYRRKTQESTNICEIILYSINMASLFDENRLPKWSSF